MIPALTTACTPFSSSGRASGARMRIDGYSPLQSFRTAAAAYTSPCRLRSFDILRDELGESRIQFPHAMYMVAGSQADEPGNNALTVARLTQLSKMRNEEDESGDSEDSDDEGDASRRPVLQSRSIAHHGCAVRARQSRL